MTIPPRRPTQITPTRMTKIPGIPFRPGVEVNPVTSHPMMRESKQAPPRTPPSAAALGPRSMPVSRAGLDPSTHHSRPNSSGNSASPAAAARPSEQPAPRTLRVLIADDHAIVLRGLRGLLQSQPGIEICAEVTNGREAVEKTEQLLPDLVLLDIGMPELNGLEATRTIRMKHPTIEVLILTMHFSEQVARQVLKAGARGYILKTDAESQLLAAIANLRQHRPFLSPRVADVVLTGFVDGNVVETIKRAVAVEFPYGPLSRRERQVMQLLAEGNSNKQVASRLGVSPRTVETHRNHVMHKLRLNSFSEMVRYAVRNNVVEP